MKTSTFHHRSMLTALVLILGMFLATPAFAKGKRDRDRGPQRGGKTVTTTQSARPNRARAEHGRKVVTTTRTKTVKRARRGHAHGHRHHQVRRPARVTTHTHYTWVRGRRYLVTTRTEFLRRGRTVTKTTQVHAPVRKVKRRVRKVRTTRRARR